jgi:hypothetical protein
MGATSTGRNPQTYSLATEQQTTSSFGRLSHKSKFTQSVLHSSKYVL